MKSKEFLVLLTLISMLSNAATYTVSAKGVQPQSAVASMKVTSTVLAGIEVKNNETLVIENGRYLMNDSVTVRDNGTLVVRNALLDFDTTDSTVLYTYDNATVIMFNTTISDAEGYYYAYIRGKTSLTVNASSFVGSSYFYFYDTSASSIANSKAYRFSASNNATVTITDTVAQYLYCYGLSTTRIVHSAVYYLYVEDSSSIIMADSTISDRISLEFGMDSSLSLSLPWGLVNRWSLYGNSTVEKAYLNITMVNTRVSLWTVNCYDTSAVTIAESTLDSVNAHDNSTVSLHYCSVSSVYVQDYCSVRLVDSTVTSRMNLEFADGSDAVLSLQIGHFAYWSLHINSTIMLAYLNLSMQNVTVAGWNIISYSSTISLTDSDVEYLYTYDNSTSTVLNSSIYLVYSYGHSHVTIASATVDWLYTYDWSVVYGQDSTFRGVYAYGNSSITASRVRTENVGVYDYASVLLIDSLTTSTAGLSFVDDSRVFLDSLPSGHVEHWSLYENATVTRAYINLTLVNTKVRGWGEISAYGESDVSVSDSVVGYFYVYGLSMVTMLDSIADYAYVYDNSSLSIMNSSINIIQLTLKSDSDVSFTSLPNGWVNHWNLYQNASVTRAYINCTVHGSWIGQLGFTTYGSTSLSFKYCTVDSAYAYESSRIQMTNCTVGNLGGYSRSSVSLSKTTVRYNVYVYDDSSWTITDSNVQSRLYMKFRSDSEVFGLWLPRGSVSHWSLHEYATVKRAFFTLTISNTVVKAWGLYTYDSSAISLINSNVDYLAEYDFSTVLMENCTLETAYVNRLSQLQLSSIPDGKSVVTNLYTYGMGTATLTESRAAITNAYGDSTINLARSYYAAIRVYDRAKVQITWSLEVHIIDQNAQNVTSAHVTVTDQSGARTYSATTDRDGLVSFNLPERTIDVLGSHPVGIYTVTGGSSGYTTSKLVEMTENKQVTINLPFTIPESSAPIFIFFFIILTISAFTLRKQFARRKVHVR